MRMCIYAKGVLWFEVLSISYEVLRTGDTINLGCQFAVAFGTWIGISI